jgi:hypothetical protein
MGRGQFKEAGEWQGKFGYKCNCVLGYIDFHNLMGFTSKKMQILYNLVQKFFRWLSHFLRICILLDPK